jgi:hypothetical protein
MRRIYAASGDLFVEIPKPAASVPGSMDFRSAVSGLCGEILRGHDRHQVAADASRLTGKDVSKYMLDGYTAESRDDFNLPAYLIPAIETVCASHALTQWLAGIRGGRLLIGREALEAEVGRIEQQRLELSERARAIKDTLRRSR